MRRFSAEMVWFSKDGKTAAWKGRYDGTAFNVRARPHTQRVVSAIRYIYKSKITILPPPPLPPSANGYYRYRRHRRHRRRRRSCLVLGGPVMNVCSATISAAPGIVHRAGPRKTISHTWGHFAVSLVSTLKTTYAHDSKYRPKIYLILSETYLQDAIPHSVSKFNLRIYLMNKL